MARHLRERVSMEQTEKKSMVKALISTSDDGSAGQIGDLVLQRIADLFSGMVRRSDMPVRMGGDEFLLLMPDTTLKMAANMAERLRRTVHRLNVRNLDGERLSVRSASG